MRKTMDVSSQLLYLHMLKYQAYRREIDIQRRISETSATTTVQLRVSECLVLNINTPLESLELSVPLQALQPITSWTRAIRDDLELPIISRHSVACSSIHRPHQRNALRSPVASPIMAADNNVACVLAFACFHPPIE